MVLTLAVSGIFCAGWLVVAALMREERPVALAWSAYSLLEGTSLVSVVASSAGGAGPGVLGLVLALLSAGAANLGGDIFVHGRARYLRFWMAALLVAIGLQVLAPNLGGAEAALRVIGYDVSLLVLLAAPLAIFARPLVTEFGRFGLLALTPLALMTSFAAFHVGRLLAVPGALATSTHAMASASAGWLLPAIVSSASFHLTWFALILGRQVGRARRLSRFDALTGLLQRNAFDVEMKRALALAHRHRQKLSVAFVDVDHFKRVNDVGGHRAGDRVLRQLAGVLQRAARASDRVGRWGGEEFVLVLPNTDAHGARIFAGRLQAAIRAEAIEVPAGCGPLSVSIGLATDEGNDVDCDALIGRADSAMYAAKHRGRDTAVTAAEGAAA
ncbi:MAG TPA: GGDEF domain-containing protein [Burkholderiaceae bacterium]|nr:GGDEF domain-containing protein [Burkholderiaceae bacterium]